MGIQKLPDEVATFVQSGVAISDATQCVLELVFNSLDANATSIAVRVNLQKFYIQVVDNGEGVTKADLSKLGKRHMTSKCRNADELECIFETFGYRGTSLASILEVSDKVEIQTFHCSEKTTYTLELSLHGEQQIFENKVNRPAHGTTVTVRNLLCTLPVRRQRIKEVFDLDDIVYQIEALAVFHCHVSFSVRNDSVGKVLLQTHRHEEPQEALSELFGFHIGKQLIPIANGRGNVRVSGFVSKELHTNTDIQLVYVNGRVLHKSKVHKLVLAILQKYGGFWEKDRNDSAEPVNVDGYVFLLKIELPYPSYTLSRNGRKASVEFRNEKEVLKCVRRAVAQSLKDGPLESSLEDVIPDAETVLPKGSGFGPSQLQNALQGRRVSRKPVTSDSAKPENVPEIFFREISGNGTALAENAPVYEMPGFSQFPFHDFIAWLQSLAAKRDKAVEFMSEWVRSKAVCIPKPSPAPLVSLKEIRKEKFNNWSNMMLKKLGDSQQMRKEIVEHASVGRTGKIIRRETTTYTRTPFRSFTPNINNFPQASFGEFLAWMKYKANHDTTADQMLKEYFSVKQPNLQESHSKRASEPVNGSQCKRIKASHQFKTPNTGKLKSSNLVHSAKSIQCTIEKTIMENSISPLYHTWQSHKYRPSDTPISYTKVTPIRRQFTIHKTLNLPSPVIGSLTNGSVNEIGDDPPSPVLMVCHQEVQAVPSTNSIGVQTVNHPKPPKKLVCVTVQTEEPVNENIVDTPKGIYGQRHSDLADTVPVSKEFVEKLSQTESRFQEFVPPMTSTRISPNEPADLPRKDLQDVEMVLQDACEDFLSSVKWSGPSEDVFEKELVELHKTGAVAIEESIKSAKLSKAAWKTEAMLSSVTFSKQDLESAVIIGQVDRKFIAVLIKKAKDNARTKFVCLIDQHAAHERVNLERLLEEYYQAGKVEMRELDCAITLTVNYSTIEIFKNEKKHFTDNGVLAEILGSSALLVRAVPACFLRRQQRELKHHRMSSLKRIVADLVDELAEHLKDTRGAEIKVPKTIMDVVSSEACRSAIKFNHSLNYAEMCDLINQLRKCQSPFQCAHGRPAIAPIFEVQEVFLPYGPPQNGGYRKFKKE